MSYYISAEKQKLIIEKLYRSTDSITSTRKFNTQYGSQIGNLGERTLLLTSFARKMKKTSFSSYDVERFTKSVTGKVIDLETL